MAADMLYTGYARIISATNATQPGIIGQDAPGASTAATALISKTYQSTGIQTQPLCDVPQFLEIFGRNPLVTEVGTAAIGRYEAAGGASTYEHEYGLPFAPAPARETRPKCVESAFQTIPYPDAVRSITKAKVKATMLVNKYRKIAEQAGIKVFAEHKVQRVIHSEKLTPLVTLDAEGNATDGDLGTLFLPNIYGEDITPATTQTFTPPLSPEPALQQKPIENVSIQYAIPSLAPSLRDDVPYPEPREDYGKEYIEAQWADEYQTRFLEEGERGDDMPLPAFVVYDPAWFLSPTKSVDKLNNAPSAKKRKRDTKDERDTTQTPRKRTKRSLSPGRIGKQILHSQHKVDRSVNVSHHRPEDMRERKSSTSDIYHREAPGYKSDLKIDNIPRGPRKDRERNATTLARTPRGRSASPRRDGHGQRYRSRSPATHDSRSYRDWETCRDEITKKEAVREQPRSSRDYRGDRDGRATEYQHRLQTPLPKKMQLISSTPGDITRATSNTNRSLEAETSFSRTDGSKYTREHTGDSGSTPTPAPRALRQQMTIDLDHDSGHTIRARDSSIHPQTQQPSGEAALSTRETSLRLIAQDNAKAATKDTKRTTTTIIKKTEDAMLQARRAEDRRRELAHGHIDPIPSSRTQPGRRTSSRVEKTYKTSSRDAVKKEKTALDDEKKRQPTSERKPPTGPRPRRDARSLINSWLGA